MKLDLPELGLTIDLRRAGLDPADLDDPAWDAAARLLAWGARGGVLNPDEARRVGHTWLRDPDRAPPEAGRAVREALTAIRDLAARVDAEGRVRHLVQVGIGGSALGPRLVVDALSPPGGAGREVHVLDNVDPEGVRRLLAHVDLARTLVLVVSKSGGTVETRHGARALAAACAERGLSFAERAVAVTCPGSPLDRQARQEGWRARLPLWDWVGGRFSATSPAGLALAALAGVDVDALVAGARALDRAAEAGPDPARWLAAAWWACAEGRGRRNLVVLPYRDRLALLAPHLQQLVMESLGKRHDLAGRTVHQGLTVYGNKGSTDQHAYVQQLREGPDDVFVQFVAVLEDAEDIEVEPGVRMGDVLLAFLVGTRRALSEAGRRTLTVVLDRLDAHRLGVLLALHERAVALYGLRAGINPFHQPGVEAGKRAARDVLALQARLQAGEAADDAPEDDRDLLLARLRATGRLE